MPGEPSRPFSDLFSRWGQRRPVDAARPESGRGGRSVATDGADAEPTYRTKALRKFLATLGAQATPVLLDLGPVVGSNVTFFGERLGCKIFVEDLFADLERHARQGALAALPEFLSKRLPQADASVDGILCWDLLDYLDKASAQALATALTRVLRVDGALLGFFATAATTEPRYTKYIVVDEANLRHRPYPGTRGRQHILQNRDIIKLFGGLRVSDSFLLQTNVREILFRRPAYLSGP